MTTRAKAGVFKPKTYASYKEGSYDHTVEPHTIKEAMAKPEWLKAMKEEHDGLKASLMLMDVFKGTRTSW